MKKLSTKITAVLVAALMAVAMCPIFAFADSTACAPEKHKAYEQCRDHQVCKPGCEWTPECCEDDCCDIDWECILEWFEGTVGFMNGGHVYGEFTDLIGTPVEFPAVDPTRDGYIFAGWDCSQLYWDCCWECYRIPLEALCQDIVVEAQWEAVEYAISFDLVEGAWAEGTVVPESYTIESDEIVLPTTIAKEGFEFLGWVDEQGNPVTSIAAGSMGDKVFKATWKEIKPAEPEKEKAATPATGDSNGLILWASVLAIAAGAAAFGLKKKFN